jgi:disulfide bond formation protein DsbB
MKILKQGLKLLTDNALPLTNLIALTGMFGSLMFSEVMDLTPCVLCWYQRILLYPLALITAVAILTKEGKTNLSKYILALSVPGTILAAYHYFIQMTGGAGLPEVCTAGASCTKIDFVLLGFITIPFLSFLAFLTITVINLLAVQSRIGKK